MKNFLTVLLTFFLLVGAGLSLKNVNKKEELGKEIVSLTTQKQAAEMELTTIKESTLSPLNENLERLPRYLFVRGTKAAIAASLEEPADIKKEVGIKPLTLTLSGENYAGILLLRDIFRNFPVVMEKAEMTNGKITTQVNLYGRNPN